MSITSERIKHFRKKNNMSQSELAEKLDIGRSNMGHIENARVEPTKEIIVQLAEIFHVSTDYLLGRTEIPNEKSNSTLMIGTMIKYFMKQNNLTMKQLGENLNRSESAVSKWISGDSFPQAKELAKMANIFDTDINTIMFGDKQNKTSKLINEISDLDEFQQEEVYNFVQYVKTKKTQKKD